MADDVFTCAVCKGVFPKGWSDEQAEAEYREDWGSLPAAEDRALVCDPCWHQVMAWVVGRDIQ